MKTERQTRENDPTPTSLSLLSVQDLHHILTISMNWICDGGGGRQREVWSSERDNRASREVVDKIRIDTVHGTIAGPCQ